MLWSLNYVGSFLSNSLIVSPLYFQRVRIYVSVKKIDIFKYLNMAFMSDNSTVAEYHWHRLCTSWDMPSSSVIECFQHCLSWDANVRFYSPFCLLTFARSLSLLFLSPQRDKPCSRCAHPPGQSVLLPFCDDQPAILLLKTYSHWPSPSALPSLSTVTKRTPLITCVVTIAENAIAAGVKLLFASISFIKVGLPLPLSFHTSLNV